MLGARRALPLAWHPATSLDPRSRFYLGAQYCLDFRGRFIQGGSKSLRDIPHGHGSSRQQRDTHVLGTRRLRKAELPKRCALGRGGRRAGRAARGTAADGCVRGRARGPTDGLQGRRSERVWCYPITATYSLNNPWMEADASTRAAKRVPSDQEAPPPPDGRQPGALQRGLLLAPPPAAGRGEWPRERCLHPRRSRGEARHDHVSAGPQARPSRRVWPEPGPKAAVRAPSCCIQAPPGPPPPPAGTACRQRGPRRGVAPFPLRQRGHPPTAARPAG